MPVNIRSTVKPQCESLEDRRTPAAFSPHDYVEKLYYQDLGRFGELGNNQDSGYWVLQLQAGASPADIARGVHGSAESLGRIVGGMYSQLLDRGLDHDAGRDAWVAQLQAGKAYEEVLAGIAGSAESSSKFPSTASFIDNLYEVVLQREPSAGEIQAWTDIAAARGRYEVALGIAASFEGQGVSIRDDFSRYLGRTATQADVDSLRGLSRLDRQVALLSSDEYTGNATRVVVTLNSVWTNSSTPVLTGIVSDPAATVIVNVTLRDDSNLIASTFRFYSGDSLPDGEVATVVGNTWFVQLPTLAPGAYSVHVFAKTPDNNVGQINIQNGLVIDQTPPTLAINTIVPPNFTGNQAPVTFTFSEPVTGFTASDIQVQGGVLSNFAGSGETYTATITGDAFTVTVAGDLAFDVFGNGNTASTTKYNADGPFVASLISNVNLTYGETDALISLDGVFGHPGGDLLTYTVASSNPSIATASLVGADMNDLYVAYRRVPPTSSATGQYSTVIARSGESTVTVTASDADGNSVSTTFVVFVTVPNGSDRFFPQ